MPLKATAKAPANIAFIKYWGKVDRRLKIPENNSISMNLSNIYTITTVEFSNRYKKDSFDLQNEQVNKESRLKVFKHLDIIRKLANNKTSCRVLSKNNFPTSTGLSSSASGFAALTLAAVTALGLKLTKKEISILARLGSGSSCRSVPNGFVEWKKGKDHHSSFAYSLYPASYWEIYDVVAIVSKDKKEIGSTAGQELATTSPFYQQRLKFINHKTKLLKKYLKDKSFTEFGALCEEEALNMHAVMITSYPPLIYWTSGTLMLMKLVQKWRKEELQTFFTINTGQDIHILTEKIYLTKLLTKLKSLDYIKSIIVNKPADGVAIHNKHLF